MFSKSQGSMEVGMFQKVFLVIAVALGLGTQALAAQSCKDISTAWTLSSTFVDGTTASRVYSDGTDYIDGGQGVSASIKCGTDDAVLILSSSRKIMFNFAGAFLGTSHSTPPSWTSGPAFGSTPSTVKNCGGSPCTLLNIRNILDSGTANRNSYYLIYTNLESGFVAPDKNGYSLAMENPATANVVTTPNDSANTPYLNTRVAVEHYAAGNGVSTCASKECWLVYPELPTSTGSQSPSPENGTLFSGGKAVNFGEFSMPFFFTIQAK